MWSGVALDKHYPPKEIREKLASLHGLCTYSLLENVRFGNSKHFLEWDADSVQTKCTGWFDMLRKTTSEWCTKEKDEEKVTIENLTREKLKWNQWKNMSDELLALDRCIQVPRDSSELQELYRAVKAIPDYLIEKLKEKIGYIKTELIPIGSFPSDAKIKDIDEFDFLLIYDGDGPDVRSVEVDFTHLMNEWFGFPDKVSVLAAADLIELPPEPIITEVYSHGPAMCTTLAWRCTNGHTHNMGCDVTIAQRSTVPVRDCFPELRVIPLFKSLLNTFDPGEMAVEVRGTPTTSAIDELLCKEMGKLSQYTLSAYRILKFLVPMVMPEILSLDFNFSELGHGTFSSHTLKLVIYEFVGRYPTPEDWTRELFYTRIHEMLNHLHQIQNMDAKSMNANIGSVMRIKPEQIVLHKTVKKCLETKLLGENANNIKILADSFEDRNTIYQEMAFSTDDTLTVTPTRSFPPYIKRLVVHDRVIFPCKNDHLQFLPIAKSSFTASWFKMPSSLVLYSTHPIVARWITHLYSLYEANPGPELTKITWDKFPDAWLLYLMGFIKAQDLRNEESFMPSVIHYREIVFSILGEHKDFAEEITKANLLVILEKTRPDVCEDLFVDFQSLFEKQDQEDRAYLHLVCKLFKSTGSLLDKGMQIYSFEAAGRYSHSVYKLLVAIDRLWTAGYWFVTEVKKFGDPHTLLAWYLVSHVLNSDPKYLQSITKSDYNKAKEYLQKDSTKYEEARKNSFFRKLAVHQDGRGLFRSVACILQQTLMECLQNVRSCTGINLTLHYELLERQDADRLKEEVVELYKSIQQNCLLVHSKDLYNSSIKDRIDIMTDARSPASYLELAAIAYLTDRQVCVYEEIGNDFELIDRIPDTDVTDFPPFRFIASYGIKEQFFTALDYKGPVRVSYGADLQEPSLGCIGGRVKKCTDPSSFLSFLIASKFTVN